MVAALRACGFRCLAIEKAVLYLDRDELPAHWDREALFGLDDASSVNDESKAGSDAESSDDETREEKDHFVAQLYKFMDDRGTPINKVGLFSAPIAQIVHIKPTLLLFMIV